MATKLKRLVIDRVDLVDRGANPDAHIVLFKRDTGHDPRAPTGALGTQSKPKGVIKTEKPNWFHVVKNAVLKMMDQAKTTNEVLAEQELNEKWWGLQDALWSSIWSIRHSEESNDIKTTKLRQSIEEFVAQANPLIAQMPQESMSKAQTFVADIQKLGPDPSELDEVAKALSDARTERASSNPASTAQVNKKDGEDTVPKTLEEFLKSLSADERTAVEAEIAKRAPAPSVPESVTKALTDATAKLETLEKRATDAEAKAKENEAKLAKAETDLAAEVEKRVATEFQEKGAKYPSAGTPEEVADMLRKAFGVSKEYGEKVEATFAKAEEQIAKGDLFKEKGRGGNTNPSSAEAQIEKMAKERAATDQISYEKAYDLVLQENRELHKRLRDEQEGN